MRCLHRLSHYYQGAILAVLSCMVLWAAPATAQVSWKRVGTVTTLTSGQLCKTDGTVIICDSTTPTISSGQVGIGTTSFSQALTVAGNIDITGTGLGFLSEIANDGSTGTTTNTLAMLTTAGAAITATTAAKDGVVGIVSGNAGTTGNAQIAVNGQASCVFDGATTAGDFVAISSITAGDCHDAGATRSTTSQTIGRILSTNGSAGTYAVEVGLNADAASSGAVLGSGTTNYIAKWTPNGSTLGIGALYDDGSGHVGIGTTSPSGLLDVSATTAPAVYIDSVSTGGGDTGQLIYRNGNAWSNPASISASYWNSPGMAFTAPRDFSGRGFAFNSNGGTTRMFIDTSSGNVGIGTTSPSTKLEVNGNITMTSGGGQTITTPGTSLMLTQTGDTFGATSLTLENRAGANGALFSNAALDLVDFGFKPMTGPQANIRLEHRSGNYLTGNSSGEWQFINNATGADTFPFRVGDGTAYFEGNVGIGVTSPAEPLTLHVNGTAVTGNWVSLANFRDATPNKGIDLGYDSSSQTGIIASESSSANSALAFWTYNGAWGERMRIDTAGNVGIGTTTPKLVLDAYGAGGYPAISGTTQTGIARFEASNSNVLDIGQANGGPWGMWLQASNRTGLGTDYPLLLNPNGGNVGIGTTSPNALLDIGSSAGTLGTMRLEGSTSGYVQIQPSTTAGSWTMTLPTAAPAGNGYVLSGTTAGVTSWVSNTPTFSGLTAGDFCTATSGTTIGCATGYTGTGSVVLAGSPTIASPTLTGTTLATNVTMSGYDTNTFGSDYTTTGLQSDVNLGTSSSMRYNGAGTATFYGIAAGAGGQELRLHNASGSTLTLSNQSGSEATAANKIITGTTADLPIPANTSVTLQYDSTAARWRVTGSSNSANTLAAGSIGQVQFNGGTNLSANANFFWDNTNYRLGIGSSTAPANTLDVFGGAAIGTSYAGANTAPANGLIVQGNVGIGTTSPLVPLHSAGDFLLGSASIPTGTELNVSGQGVYGLLYTTDATAGGWGEVLMGAQAQGNYSGSQITFGYGDNSNAWQTTFSIGAEINNVTDPTTSDFWIFNNNLNASALAVEGNNDVLLGGLISSGAGQAITIKSGGSVGIGSTAPTEKLDVAGTVKVAGTGSEACSSSTVGQIRYNPTGQYMEICTYP
jgi:hypothetical protein